VYPDKKIPGREFWTAVFTTGEPVAVKFLAFPDLSYQVEIAVPLAREEPLFMISVASYHAWTPENVVGTKLLVVEAVIEEEAEP
jgi:hypothetical protein